MSTLKLFIACFNSAVPGFLIRPQCAGGGGVLPTDGAAMGPKGSSAHESRRTSEWSITLAGLHGTLFHEIMSVCVQIPIRPSNISNKLEIRLQFLASCPTPNGFRNVSIRTYNTELTRSHPRLEVSSRGHLNLSSHGSHPTTTRPDRTQETVTWPMSRHLIG